MKLSLVRVLPLAIALLVPSAALAEGQAAGSHKSHTTHTVKRAKAGAKAAKKAPKAAKKAPKAAKKAPKAAKKAAK